MGTLNLMFMVPEPIINNNIENLNEIQQAIFIEKVNDFYNVNFKDTDIIKAIELLEEPSDKEHQGTMFLNELHQQLINNNTDPTLTNMYNEIYKFAYDKFFSASGYIGGGKKRRKTNRRHRKITHRRNKRHRKSTRRRRSKY